MTSSKNLNAASPYMGIIPSLGSYLNTSVVLGNNIVVQPITPPVNVNIMNARASAGFEGVLAVNPVSGAVTITNAKPAGTYTIIVKSGSGLTSSFLLLVRNANCSQANFYRIENIIPNAQVTMTVGDFNNDGKHDIVMGGVEIYTKIGDGQGGFTGSNTVIAGNSPSSIATGDFNSDGNLDIAVANSQSNNVSIRLGDGTGGFTGNTEIPVNATPRSIAVADFNADGFPDFVTANSGAGNVSVRLGDGMGGFSGNTTVAVGMMPYSVAINDFNGDGKHDIAVANLGSHTVSIRLGNGLGTFSGSTEINVGSYPSNLAIGDFNNDGIKDFATVNSGSGNVSIRIGNGFGGFNGITEVYIPGTPNLIAISDFNGDGNHDIVASTQYSGSYLRLGDGLGGFNTITSISSPVTITGETTADLNSDGLQDIITLRSSSSLTVLMGSKNEINLMSNGNAINDGSSNISLSNNTDIGSAGTCNPISKIYTIQNSLINPISISGISFTGSNTSDFTVSGVTFPAVVESDSSLDFNIVFTASAPGIRSATVNISNDDCDESDFDFAIEGTGLIPSLGDYPDTTVTAGGNLFISPMALPVNLTHLNVKSSIGFTGNLSADPNTGIVRITNANPAGIYTITVSAGSCIIRTFILTVTSPLCSQSNSIPSSAIAIGLTPTSVAIGDFNGDGIQDIANSNLSNSGVVNVRLGNGFGGFSGGADVGVGGANLRLAIADFNGDGNDDFAVPVGSNIIIRLGDGTGNFQNRPNVPVSATPRHIATGDFNNDGYIDFATANGSPGTTISVRYGNGMGYFTGATELIAGTNPVFVVVGDFNSDGNHDIACANNFSANVSIFPGDGIGGFGPRTNVTVGSNPNGIALGDYNNDGNQDMAVSTSATNNFSLLTGDGLGGFTVTAISGVPHQSSYVAAGDVNGDGNLDLLFAIPGLIQSLRIMNGNGAGGFTGPIVINTSNTSTIAVGEFNGDQRLDLALSLNGNSFYAIRLGAVAEVNMQGNGNNIPDESTSASVLNNTDFGDVVIGSPVAKTFTIQNTGNTVLAVSSITKTGINPAEFTVSGLTFPTTIAASNFKTFTIVFNPAATGVRSVILHVNNNDCDESDYNFLIQGNGIINCNVNISDNNVCTIDACDPINGITHTQVNVDDSIACTIDGCDPVSGIYHTPGIEICSNRIDDDCDGLIDEDCYITLNVKLFIQGFYSGNSMMGSTVDPVNYPDLCDTLIIELHESTPPYNIYLADTGTVDIYGNGYFYFPLATLGDSFYIVTRHRNALETWSTQPFNFDDTTSVYSFVDSVSKAFGNNLYELGDGNFALFSGDISDARSLIIDQQDGLIDNFDYSYMEQSVRAILVGYVDPDLTGDRVVESDDYLILQNSTHTFIMTIKP